MPIRYKFKELHTIQWEQLSDDPEQNDLRSMSLPPKASFNHFK